MKAGDIVQVKSRFGTVKGRVLATSNAEYLDYEILESGERRYIGVSPMGNPRVKVLERVGTGEDLPLKEWEHE